MINDHIHFGGGGDAVFRLEKKAYEDAGYEVFTFSQSSVAPGNISTRDYVCITSGSRFLSKIGKFLGVPSVYASLRKVLTEVKPHFIRVHLVSNYPVDIYSALHGYEFSQTLHGPNLFCATSWGNLKKDSSACDLGIGIKCWSNGCVSLPTMALYKQLSLRIAPSLKKNVLFFHCPSKQIEEKALLHGYHPTIHIPLGVDYEFINALPATHDGTPTLLYVGALAEVKGVQYLPEILGLVKKKIPNIKLVICGRGNLEDFLRKEFLKRKLLKNVEFKGFVEHEKMAELYRQASVFICPSIYSEQFGLVGAEALACGVPCVGSNVGGIPEWLHDEQWGFLVPPRNVEMLAQKVMILMKNKSLRIEFGQKGREFILENHHPRAYQQRWLEIAKKQISLSNQGDIT